MTIFQQNALTWSCRFDLHLRFYVSIFARFIYLFIYPRVSAHNTSRCYFRHGHHVGLILEDSAINHLFLSNIVYMLLTGIQFCLL